MSFHCVVQREQNEKKVTQMEWSMGREERARVNEEKMPFLPLLPSICYIYNVRTHTRTVHPIHPVTEGRAMQE